MYLQAKQFLVSDFICKLLRQAGVAATLLFVLTASAFASTDGPAELPRVYVSSSMASTPAPGKRILVPAGANLGDALRSAHCGDTLLLQAGATFNGNYGLPAKPCDDQHWIVIRTSAPDSALPAEGKRISPCYSGVSSLPGRPSFNCASATKVMARIVATNGGPITFHNAANHYRLGPGLEITRPLNTVGFTDLISTSGAANSIVVDRDWIHGVPQYDTMRGVMLSGITRAAVVDSYLNDFHCAATIGDCADSQAITGGTGDYPQGIWKIHDNFLEAAAETILFGGSARNSVTPGDIEISNNHMFKPMTWMPGQPGFVARPNTNSSVCTKTPGYCAFVVKNLFELKNAQRVLLDGNILENCWAGFSQYGYAILVNGLNIANATLSYISVMDVTIRYNRSSHTASVFVLADPGPDTLPIGKFSIHDNVFDDVSPKYQNGETIGGFSEYTYCSSSPCKNGNISINHNTVLMSQPNKWFAVVGAVTGPIPNWTYTNNIVSVNSGISVINVGSNGCASGQKTNASKIAACFSPFTMTHNALIGGSGTWPAGNHFPTSPSAAKFVNYNNGNGGNYALLSSSPYHNAGTDGKDLGANIGAVNSHTAGVE